MADKKPKKTATPQDKETKVETGHASAAPGEIDPSADQSNRSDVLAAQLASAPVKTLDVQKAEEAKKSHETSFVNESGETEFVDPDELEVVEVHETIPTDVCINCKHQGRESQLDDKGFCKKCGFKLNRLHNIQLEPAQRPLNS